MSLGGSGVSIGGVGALRAVHTFPAPGFLFLRILFSNPLFFSILPLCGLVPDMLQVVCGLAPGGPKVTSIQS